MKGLLFFTICLCTLFSGCLTGIKTAQQPAQKEEVLPETKDPYGKYSLETADVEVWFYDNCFIYLDRGRKVLKTYEGIDRSSD